MTKILISIIKIYKIFISSLLGNRCRFLPSCSEYFIEALETHGFKCHPLKYFGGSSGLDRVPTTNNKEKKNG